MNPNPLSRTSRLIVPLDIRVSLGASICPDWEYQVSFQLNFQRFSVRYSRAIKLIRAKV
jgi:hypothetical protein